MSDLLERANKWLEISHGRDVNYLLVSQLTSRLSASQAMNEKMAEALMFYEKNWKIVYDVKDMKTRKELRLPNDKMKADKGKRAREALTTNNANRSE